MLDETAELHSKRMRLTVHWLGGDWVMDAEAVARGGRAGGLPPAKKMDLRVESAATVADLIVKVKGEVRVCGCVLVSCRVCSAVVVVAVAVAVAVAVTVAPAVAVNCLRVWRLSPPWVCACVRACVCVCVCVCVCCAPAEHAGCVADARVQQEPAA